MAISKEEKKSLISQFGTGAQDSGSTEVQIALLTSNIRELTDHCQRNPKDFSSKRGLLKMVCRRRNLLRYLQRTDNDKYKNVIAKLGLRK